MMPAKVVNDHKQSGAIMLEAAYVLPLVILVVLMIVESVNYSLDSLKLNNVMDNGYQVVMIQAQQLNSDPTKTLSTVKCSGGSGSLIGMDESGFKTWLTNAVAMSVGKNGVAPSGLTISIVLQTVGGILTYVVKMSYPSQTIFLPTAMMQHFPVKTQGLFSFNLTC